MPKKKVPQDHLHDERNTGTLKKSFRKHQDAEQSPLKKSNETELKLANLLEPKKETAFNDSHSLPLPKTEIIEHDKEHETSYDIDISPPSILKKEVPGNFESEQANYSFAGFINVEELTYTNAEDLLSVNYREPPPLLGPKQRCSPTSSIPLAQSIGRENTSTCPREPMPVSDLPSRHHVTEDTPMLFRADTSTQSVDPPPLRPHISLSELLNLRETTKHNLEPVNVPAPPPIVFGPEAAERRKVPNSSFSLSVLNGSKSPRTSKPLPNVVTEEPNLLSQTVTRTPLLEPHRVSSLVPRKSINHRHFQENNLMASSSQKRSAATLEIKSPIGNPQPNAGITELTPSISLKTTICKRFHNAKENAKYQHSNVSQCEEPQAVDLAPGNEENENLEQIPNLLSQKQELVALTEERLQSTSGHTERKKRVRRRRNSKRDKSNKAESRSEGISLERLSQYLSCLLPHTWFTSFDSSRIDVIKTSLAEHDPRVIIWLSLTMDWELKISVLGRVLPADHAIFSGESRTSPNGCFRIVYFFNLIQQLFDLEVCRGSNIRYQNLPYKTSDAVLDNYGPDHFVVRSPNCLLLSEDTRCAKCSFLGNCLAMALRLEESQLLSDTKEPYDDSTDTMSDEND